MVKKMETENTQTSENPFFTYQQKTHDILVEAQPFYLKERSIPEQNHYFYAYKINITNTGKQDYQLLRRHWLIRNGKGSQREVEGAGVVGQNPTLAPNESFSYTSYCPLDTPTGNMRGSFLFTNDEGDKFSASVPVFFFRPPHTFH